MFILTENNNPSCQIVGPVEPDPQTAHTLNVLKRNLRSITGCTIPMVPWGHRSRSLNALVIGEPDRDDHVCELLTSCRVALDRQHRIVSLKHAPNGNQGYILCFARKKMPRTCVLAGNTSQGTFYGVQSFCDRIFQAGNGTFGLKETDVTESPTFEHRSFFGNLGGPDWLASHEFEKAFGRVDGRMDTQAFVDWVARFRINNLTLNLFDLMWGLPYRSARFPDAVNRLHPNVRHEFFRQLLRQAKENYVDVWLQVSFPDCWLGVIRAYPAFAGQGLPQSDVLRNSEAWWKKFYAGMSYQEVRPLRPSSFVCANKPSVMEFWKGYWEEVLSLYPDVAGIGGQWCEHVEYHCQCPICCENFDYLQWRYFQAMVDVAEATRPGLAYWLWHAPGAREICRHRQNLPNLTYVYWGDGAVRPPVPRAQGTKVDWYLTHGMSDPDYEPWIKKHLVSCHRLNLTGVQKRMALFTPCEQVYFAFSQFAWRPRLSWSEFAERWLIRSQRIEAPRLAAEYARSLQSRYSHLPSLET